MPRKKRKDVAPPVESGAESILAVADLETPQSISELSESSSPIEGPVESTVSDKQPRGQFRSWVSDSARGYSRLTDNVHNRLVLKFDAKPNPDVLAAVKEAGFEFKPEYYGQQNVWIRRNDFQGRIQTESIEGLVRGAAMGRELQPG